MPTKHMWIINVSRAFLFASLFLFGLWAPPLVPTALAASCNGSSCHGYNPETMGCSAGAVTVRTGDFWGARVEERFSSTCDAVWERTTNISGGNRYAAGSDRYGCADYCYHMSVSSPAAIANNASVYTPMVAPHSTIDTKSCGVVSYQGPINLPVTYNCNG